MTDPRWEQLIQLVGRLPPDKAQKLRELLNSVDFSNIAADGFSQMMRTLELRSSDVNGGPGPETLMRRVCRRLEPFLVNSAEGAEDGVVNRATLMIWWKAAKAQSRQIGSWELEFSEALAAQDAGRTDSIGIAAASELARQALQPVIKGVPNSAVADIRRIGAILSGGAALFDALDALGLTGPVTPKTRIALADVAPEQFQAAYIKASQDLSYNPIWLAHAVMNRLDRPWDVLYLIRLVHAASAPAIRLEDTELAPLVQRVMGLLRYLAEQSIARIKEAAKEGTLDQIVAVGDWTTRYFDASEVVAGQVKIERDSPWGRIFLTLRKTISETVSDRLSDFEDVMVGFVEDWAEEIQLSGDNPEAQRAFAAVDLLGAWRARADRHGFGIAFAAFDRRTLGLLSRSLGRSVAGKDLWLGQKRRMLQTLRLV